MEGAKAAIFIIYNNWDLIVTERGTESQVAGAYRAGPSQVGDWVKGHV